MRLKDFEEKLKVESIKAILLDYEKKIVGLGAFVLGIGAVMGIGGGILRNRTWILFGNNIIMWGMIFVAVGLMIGELRKNGYLKKEVKKK